MSSVVSSRNFSGKEGNFLKLSEWLTSLPPFCTNGKYLAITIIFQKSIKPMDKPRFIIEVKGKNLSSEITLSQFFRNHPKHPVDSMLAPGFLPFLLSSHETLQESVVLTKTQDTVHTLGQAILLILHKDNDPLTVDFLCKIAIQEITTIKQEESFKDFFPVFAQALISNNHQFSPLTGAKEPGYLGTHQGLINFFINKMEEKLSMLKTRSFCMWQPNIDYFKRDTITTELSLKPTKGGFSITWEKRPESGSWIGWCKKKPEIIEIVALKFR